MDLLMDIDCPEEKSPKWRPETFLSLYIGHLISSCDISDVIECFAAKVRFFSQTNQEAHIYYDALKLKQASYLCVLLESGNQGQKLWVTESVWSSLYWKVPTIVTDSNGHGKKIRSSMGHLSYGGYNLSIPTIFDEKSRKIAS